MSTAPTGCREMRGVFFQFQIKNIAKKTVQNHIFFDFFTLSGRPAHCTGGAALFKQGPPQTTFIRPIRIEAACKWQLKVSPGLEDVNHFCTTAWLDNFQTFLNAQNNLLNVTVLLLILSTTCGCSWQTNTNKWTEPKPKQRAATRHWVFTLNNYNEHDDKGAWLPDSEYWVIGKEVGENGTPHLQGYVVFMDRLRLAQIQKYHPTCARCHWEEQSQFSTPKQASDYCKKGGDFLEHGEWYIEFTQCAPTELQSSDDNSDYSTDELTESEDEDDNQPLRRTRTVAFNTD